MRALWHMGTSANTTTAVRQYIVTNPSTNKQTRIEFAFTIICKLKNKTDISIVDSTKYVFSGSGPRQ